jgi:hypothetical protein
MLEEASRARNPKLYGWSLWLPNHALVASGIGQSHGRGCRKGNNSYNTKTNSLFHYTLLETWRADSFRIIVNVIFSLNPFRRRLVFSDCTPIPFCHQRRVANESADKGRNRSGDVRAIQPK